MELLLYFMQLCLEVIKVEPRGDCASETALVPLHHYSMYNPHTAATCVLVIHY